MKFSQELHLKRANVETGEFSAVAWAFGEPDRQGDIIDKGAFVASLAQYAKNGNLPPLLWQHDHNEPVGSWLELKETAEGLEGAGRVSLETTKGRDVYPLLKSGALSLSIGFQSEPSDSYTENGIRHFTKVDLLEISLVSVPANQNAVIREVKTFSDCENERDFESLVRDALGLSRRQAKRLTSVGFPVLTQRDAVQADEENEQAIIAALKAATHIIRTSK
jgi:HK97 family phage prohead protease